MSGNGYGARRRRKKEGEERGMRTMSYDIIGDAWVLRETEDDDYKIFIKLFSLVVPKSLMQNPRLEVMFLDRGMIRYPYQRISFIGSQLVFGSRPYLSFFLRHLLLSHFPHPAAVTRSADNREVATSAESSYFIQSYHPRTS